MVEQPARRGTLYREAGEQGMNDLAKLPPTTREAIQALDDCPGPASWDDIAFHMGHRTDAAVTRGINHAIRNDYMHWRSTRIGQRLFKGSRPRAEA